MPKEVHHISKFISGVITTPSETDLNPDTASFSLNVDPVSKDGALKAIPYDTYYGELTQIGISPSYNSGGGGSQNDCTIRAQYPYKLFDMGQKLKITVKEANGAGDVVNLSIDGGETILTSATIASNNTYQDFHNENWEFKFTSKTGHTAGESWTWSPTVAASETLKADKMQWIKKEGKYDLVWFDSSDNELKYIQDYYGVRGSSSQVIDFSSALTNDSKYAMQPNNEEIHIGLGPGTGSNSKWAGYIDYGQFGSTVLDTPVLADSRLLQPNQLPGMDKVIKVDNVFVGFQRKGQQVFTINMSDGGYNKESGSIFADIRAIAYHNETSFWVLDRDSVETFEVSQVSIDNFEIVFTCQVLGIKTRGQEKWGGSNDERVITGKQVTGVETVFDCDDWFGDSDTFITDMCETDGALWFARGCGPVSDVDAMIENRFLFRKKTIPTESGDFSVKDVSFRCNWTDDQGDVRGVNGGYGQWIDNHSTNDGTTDVSVKLQIPFCPLVTVGNGVGLVCVPWRVTNTYTNSPGLLDGQNATSVDGPLAMYTNDGNEGVYTTMTVSSESDGRRAMLFCFHDDEFAKNYPGSLYTNEPIQINTNDYKAAVKFRRLFWGSTAPVPLNRYIHSVSCQGNSDASADGGVPTFALAYNTTNTTASKLRTIYYAIDHANNVLDIGSGDWDNEDGGDYTISTDGNISISYDTDEHPTLEITKPYIYAEDTSAGCYSYLFRTTSDVTDNQYQAIKVHHSGTNTNTIVFAEEGDISITFTKDVSSDFYSSGDWGGLAFGTNVAKMFYKFSYVYDGYQESPLSNVYISTNNEITEHPDNPDDITTYRNTALKVTIGMHNLTSLNPRIKYLNMYCATSTDNASTAPDGFYRMVQQFNLNSQFIASAGDEDAGLSPAWSGKRVRNYTHSGRVNGISYEAATGVSEAVLDTGVNYGLSTQLNNHHFVADTYNTILGKTPNIIYKSKPYRFDQFDVSLDLLRLSSAPLAITAFSGRIYAWDSETTYRIEPNGFYVEDIFDGVGCFGPNSFVVTEYGMCFCDKNNIYFHDGQKPMPIGNTILRGDDSSWENILTDNFDPFVVFDSLRNSFVILHEAKDGSNKAWAFNIDKRRWDYWDMADDDNIRSTLQGKDGVIIIGQDQLWNYLQASGYTKRNYSWHSSKLTMGTDSQDKFFKTVRVTGTTDDIVDTITTSQGTPTKTYANDTDNSKYKLTGAGRKGKWIQVKIDSETAEIDSIGTIFRRRGVR